MRSLSDIKPGQTIGRYEFLVPVAEGGMASVWAARMRGTHGFQKTLAVKMMLGSISDNETFEQMFLDEARIASRIHHPNVVEILDLGDENGVLYIVMEYVDGEPLSAIFRTAIRKGGIPLGIAVRIVADAALGLHAAHDLKGDDDHPLGLVHRDVSPQNILVSYDGNVKIVDFGVALANTRGSEKTEVGTVKGKASYMAPEQALGKALDRRTDVFALGIVLFQVTTGKHPFKGENDIVTLHNTIERPTPAPSTLVPSYPRPLEAVVMKALEKDPAKRYQSAAELEAALDRVMPPTAPRVRPTDVAKFVREIVGDRGERRRDALRQAVKLADEHWANVAEAQRLLQRPVHDIGMTGQFTAINALNLPSGLYLPPGSFGPGGLPPLGAPPSPPSLPPPTSQTQPSITAVATPGVSSTTPPPADTKSASKAPLVLGVLAFVIVGGAGAGYMAMKGKPAEPEHPVKVAAPPPSSAEASSAPTASAVETAAAPPASASDAAAGSPGSIDLTALPTATTTERPGRPGVPVAVGGHGAPPAATTKDDPPKGDPPKGDKPKPPGGGFVPPPLVKPDF